MTRLSFIPAGRNRKSKGIRGRLPLQTKRNSRFTLTYQISAGFFFPRECLCRLALEGQLRVVWIVPGDPIVIQLFFFFSEQIKRECYSLL